MTKKEIQKIMAIVRPAIIAMFGRQTLRLDKYNDMLAYQNRPGTDLWLEIGRYEYDEEADDIIRTESYKVHLEDGKVTSLGKGKLNL